MYISWKAAVIATRADNAPHVETTLDWLTLQYEQYKFSIAL